MSENITLNQQMSLWGDSPVRIYQLPESARVWLESEAAYGLSSIEFLRSLSRDSSLLKMCPVYCHLPMDGTLPLSFEGWQSAGIMRPGESWMLNISEWPNAAGLVERRYRPIKRT